MKGTCVSPGADTGPAYNSVNVRPLVYCLRGGVSPSAFTISASVPKNFLRGASAAIPVSRACPRRFAPVAAPSLRGNQTIIFRRRARAAGKGSLGPMGCGGLAAARGVSRSAVGRPPGYVKGRVTALFYVFRIILTFFRRRSRAWPDHAARPSPRGCARMPEGVLCTRGGEIRNATP